MRPNRVLQIHHVIEATDVLGLNAQSPLKLGWRLRVVCTHTRRFETTIRLGAPFGLMDPAAPWQPPDLYRLLLAPPSRRDTTPLTNSADLRAASDLMITGRTVGPLSLKPSGPSVIIDRERRINVSCLFVGIGAGG